MFIPVRCFTCGKVIGNLYKSYKEQSDKIDKEFQENFKQSFSKENEYNVIKEEYKNIHPAYKNKILDNLGLNRLCCRRHMISHVNIIEKI